MYVCMYVCVNRCGEGGPLLEHLLRVVDVEVDDSHLVAALLGGDERVDLLQKLVILLPGRFKWMYVCIYVCMNVCMNVRILVFMCT